MLEAEILSLRSRVERLDRERGALENFAGLAAHELLKPVITTETLARVTLDSAGDRLDSASRDDLETLAGAASRMRRLVETLLADAQESGRPLHREPVDLSRVVDECLVTLGGDIRARRARVEVDPLPVVPGNAVLLGGLFRNLLSNALEHGAGPGSAIRVSVEPADGGWTFAIDSPGPAIPEPERRRLFEPGRRSTDRRARGTRFGLTFVRRIAERHDGEVGVVSPNGSTNRFYFTLPAWDPAQDAAPRIR